MGSCYFAVDYEAREQMWPPSNWEKTDPITADHPLHSMIRQKNSQGGNFVIVSDVDTYEEHDFKDITKNFYK